MFLINIIKIKNWLCILLVNIKKHFKICSCLKIIIKQADHFVIWQLLAACVPTYLNCRVANCFSPFSLCLFICLQYFTTVIELISCVIRHALFRPNWNRIAPYRLAARNLALIRPPLLPNTILCWRLWNSLVMCPSKRSWRSRRPKRSRRNRHGR